MSTKKKCVPKRICSHITANAADMKNIYVDLIV